MTKDFMTLVDMGICDKAEALRCYCSSSSVFFPPHPQFVVDSTVTGFKLYWQGKISLEKLREYCYLRSIDGLYKYYGQFLQEED
jgi:hypothetical protein